MRSAVNGLSIWLYSVPIVSGVVRQLFVGRSADRQRRRKKKHLIEAAPFGRLDQLLWTAVQGGGLGQFWPPPAKTEESGGQCPPAKTEKN